MSDETPHRLPLAEAVTAFADLMFLVEMEAFIGDPESPSADPTARPEAAAPEAEEIPIAGGSSESITTLAYSDRGWVGRGDDPLRPHIPYWGRVIQPLQYERTLPITGGGQRAASQLGHLELDNGDGLLIGTAQGSYVAGRPVRILSGSKYRPGQPLRHALYDSFAPLLHARAERWVMRDSGVAVELRDASAQLDGPAHGNVYLGTGGIEGGEAQAGRRRPLCFGLCRNVSPDLVDSPGFMHQVYQVHSRRIDAVTAVRDKGVPLAGPHADYPDYGALIAATIPDGAFATCLAQGLIRLYDTPKGQLTADVRGDAEGGYVQTTASIALRYLTGFAGVTAIDEAAFAALPDGTIGLFVPAGDTGAAAAVLERLMAGVLAWWGGDRNGLLTCGRLAPPDPLHTVAVLRERDILSLTPLPTDTPIQWRQSVRYRTNWTVQSDLAASVGAEDRAYWEQDGLITGSFDGAVKVRSLLAVEGPLIASLFDERADATAVADLAVALFGRRRRQYALTMAWYGQSLDLGATVRVTDPRHGLNARSLLVVGTREDARDNTLTLTLWG